MEFALAIPMLALIIALTFFCGYALTNKQHITAASRYAVWSGAYGQAAPSDDQLNAMFLASKGDQIVTSQSGWASATLEELVTWVGCDDQSAGDFLDQCIGDGAAHSRSGEVAAEFPSSIGAWQSFIGPRRSAHFRDGGQWTRGELSYLEPVREQFLSDLDSAVLDIRQDQEDDSPMVSLTEALRDLYSQRW